MKNSSTDVPGDDGILVSLFVTLRKKMSVGLLCDQQSGVCLNLPQT